VDAAKPSQDLLRSLTDEHVLRALMRHRRLTRAELAAATGVSKPTAGESVRRLTELGLVADTGERTPGGRGRGRVGSYYALADTVGVALVVSIAPEGIVAECVDSYGDVIARRVHHIDRSRPPHLTAAIRTTVTQAQDDAGAPSRLAVVSAADPVDRRSGRLVHLPDAPFLVGELSPVEVLGPYVAGPIVVDNDVNWAAQAERDADGAGTLDNYAYLHLGEGLGCAVVTDGQVLRGHRGIAGEVAHLITVGRHGEALPFTEVFAQLGLRRSGSTAIESEALGRAITKRDGDGQALSVLLGRSISGVLTAVVALVDPQIIVVGGSWGIRPTVIDAISAEFRKLPRHVPVRAAHLTGEPSLAGARGHAVDMLRSTIVNLPDQIRIAASR
jgi:predicted NBD/HSP70 family sugar kinase